MSVNALADVENAATENESQAIELMERAYVERMTSLGQSYCSAMAALQKEYLKAGRKHAWMAAEREIEACSKGLQGITNNPMPTISADLLTLRKQYESAFVRLREARLDAISRLSQKQAGATELETAVEDVRGVATEERPVRHVPNALREVTSAGVTVHREEAKASPPEGVRLRPHRLMPTANSPRDSTTDVRLQWGTRTEETEEGDTKGDRHYVVLAVVSGEAYEEPLVCLQTIVVAATGRDTEGPRLADVQFSRPMRLDPKPLWVKFSPVPIAVSSYSKSVSSYSAENNWLESKVAGFLVSIFRRDGVLLYEAVTSLNIRDAAKGQIPPRNPPARRIEQRRDKDGIASARIVAVETKRKNDPFGKKIEEMQIKTSQVGDFWSVVNVAIEVEDGGQRYYGETQCRQLSKSAGLESTSTFVVHVAIEALSQPKITGYSIAVSGGGFVLDERTKNARSKDELRDRNVGAQPLPVSYHLHHSGH